MDAVIHAGHSEDPFVVIERDGVVPVVTLHDASDAGVVGEALLAGGLTCVEITFRTHAAATAIATLTAAHPELLVGAGTVLTVDQARAAAAAGSRFVVSPGFDDDVVAWCQTHEVPVLPGVMTPTEITRAIRAELEWVKFFPAEAAGGVETVKALSAAFPRLRFVPTGGIGPSNLADYLRVPAVAACGGSWLASGDLKTADTFDRIRQSTEHAVTMVRRVRGGA